jgi:hypothetical protein
VDAAELERIEAELPNLIRKMHEAQDKELDADDPARKQRYAALAADYEGRVKLLRGRIDTFKRETSAVEVDYKQIASRIRDARKTTDPREHRRIELDWVEKVRVANGEAAITLRVPVVNRQRDVGHPCPRQQLPGRQGSAAGTIFVLGPMPPALLPRVFPQQLPSERIDRPDVRGS